jgi:hypothetical protein
LVSSVFSNSRIRLVDSRPSMIGMEISVKSIRLSEEIQVNFSNTDP